MKIHFDETCNTKSPVVENLFLELNELEKKCVEATLDEPSAYVLEEASITCPGRNPDGSCGLVGNFPCLSAIIDDCIE